MQQRPRRVLCLFVELRFEVFEHQRRRDKDDRSFVRRRSPAHAHAHTHAHAYLRRRQHLDGGHGGHGEHQLMRQHAFHIALLQGWHAGRLPLPRHVQLR